MNLREKFEKKFVKGILSLIDDIYEGKPPYNKKELARWKKVFFERADRINLSEKEKIEFYDLFLNQYIKEEFLHLTSFSLYDNELHGFVTQINEKISKTYTTFDQVKYKEEETGIKNVKIIKSVVKGMRSDFSYNKERSRNEYISFKKEDSEDLTFLMEFSYGSLSMEVSVRIGFLKYFEDSDEPFFYFTDIQRFFPIMVSAYNSYGRYKYYSSQELEEKTVKCIEYFNKIYPYFEKIVKNAF